MYTWKDKGPATMPHIEFNAIFVEHLSYGNKRLKDDVV
jgi:hypothetical protein